MLMFSFHITVLPTFYNKKTKSKELATVMHKNRRKQIIGSCVEGKKPVLLRILNQKKSNKQTKTKINETAFTIGKAKTKLSKHFPFWRKIFINLI